MINKISLIQFLCRIIFTAPLANRYPSYRRFVVSSAMAVRLDYYIVCQDASSATAVEEAFLQAPALCAAMTKDSLEWHGYLTFPGCDKPFSCRIGWLIGDGPHDMLHHIAKRWIPTWILMAGTCSGIGSVIFGF